MIRQPSVASHSLPEAATAQLDPVLTPGGLIVGREGREPLVVRLFHARPTRVGLFASAHVARVLAHRALALGAQVVVITGRPQLWGSLVRAAPVGQTWVSVLAPNAPAPPAGTLVRPTLIVDDVGGTHDGVRRDLGPWQTGVTLRPYVTPQSVGFLHSYDLLVLQRSPAEMVGPVRAAFNLPADSTQWLPRMPDDTLAVAQRGRMRFVNIALTQVEQMTFGAPTRQDTP